MSFHEEAFEGAAKIVAGMMDEADVPMTKDGAEKVAEFFGLLYKKMRDIAEEVDEEPAKPGSFEIYKDKAGEYRFNLKACNGQIIASSQGYKSKDSCLNGIESVKKSSQEASVKEI
ncbi:MAG: YegP family protein [Firmicutes bacterium]|nr:YegP family protein [Bacillota bacterium]